MKKTVVFNIGGTETRVAILEGQELAELYIERNENTNAVGNVYKGVVEGVIPGLQAVFVNIGTAKNAFLHYNDVNVEPYLADAIKMRQGIRKRTRSRPREGPAPDQGFYIRIEDILKKGRDIMVQMTKEPIGTKGARVSANLTLPGRYMVLMPGMEGEGGVSKKIEDVTERRRLKRILEKIDVPDASFIIRTAGIGKTTKELYGDVDSLMDTWEKIQAAYRDAKPGSLIYSDDDILGRFLRDNLPPDTGTIIVDDAEARDAIVASLKNFAPHLASQVKLHNDPRSVFERYSVEKAINTALMHDVPLASGGRLVFDEMEALTAIDVNSGKAVRGRDQEKLIVQTNLEACVEIAKQLRLRDIGGLIVIDFIDMATREGQRKVYERFREELRKDRTKLSIGHFSEFGCLEMTRKRVRNSLRNTLMRSCPYCAGGGRIVIASQVWKRVHYALLPEITKGKGGNYEIIVHPHMSDYITENLTQTLAEWEKRYRVRLDVRVEKTYHFETHSILRNGQVIAEAGMDKVESFHEIDYMAPSVSARDAEEDGDTNGRRVPPPAAARTEQTPAPEYEDEEELVAEADEEGIEAQADVAPTTAEMPIESPADDADDTPAGRRGRRRERARGRILNRARARSDGGELPAPEENGDREPHEAPPVVEPPVPARQSAPPPAPVARVASTPRPALTGHDPGLYGELRGAVATRKKFKRARFDYNQPIQAHYGWTAMGPMVGAQYPPKTARPAASTTDVGGQRPAESSLMTDAFVAAKTGVPAVRSKQSAAKSAAPAPRKAASKAATSKAAASKAAEPDEATPTAEAGEDPKPRARRGGRASTRKAATTDSKAETRAPARKSTAGAAAKSARAAKSATAKSSTAKPSAGGGRKKAPAAASKSATATRKKSGGTTRKSGGRGSKSKADPA